MIYFDNAATSLPKAPGVAEAMAEALATFGGAGRSGHGAALAADRCIYRARVAVGELFGAKPTQVAFTGNATAALNLAINGLLGPDDHAITTVFEHNSVLRPLYRLEEAGMDLDFMGMEADGTPAYDDLERLLRPNTKAVVCTHASNLTGAVIDLRRVGEFCRAHGLLLIVDAAQTAGVFPITMADMPIDALAFTGHKGLLGPQGTGGLVLREGLAIPPAAVGGSGMHSFDRHHPDTMPEALEAGTPNAHGIAGLLAGLNYLAGRGIDAIREREQALAARFAEGVAGLPGVKCYTPSAGACAPVVSLNIADVDAGRVSDALHEMRGICTRPGAHCAPLIHRALGTERQGAVRFSFSSFNTEEEVDVAIGAIGDLCESWGGDAL